MTACPFCSVLTGVVGEHNAPADIAYRDDTAAALISPKWWLSNPGHVLVVPVEHFENIYEIPDAVLAHVYSTARRVALALKVADGCEGTSTRQHNEAGGGQDVWHFHVHVFPRHAGDRLYERNAETRWATAAERAGRAEELRAHL